MCSWHANSKENSLLSPWLYFFVIFYQSNQRPDSSAIVQRSPMEELYQSCLGLMDPVSSSSSLSSPHISVVPNKLLFNHKLSSSLSTSSACFRFVSITNHTRGKLRYSTRAYPGSHFLMFWYDAVHPFFVQNDLCHFSLVWCGLFPKTLPLLSPPCHVTWLLWSLPHSEWHTAPSTSIPCMERNWSALLSIR